MAHIIKDKLPYRYLLQDDLPFHIMLVDQIHKNEAGKVKEQSLN